MRQLIAMNLYRLRALLVVVLLLAAMAAGLLAHMAKPAHAATFTVTNTNDSGAGSLRKAIEDANATTAADTINFNIPSGGLQTISPTSVLPPITEPLIINGYSQPESSPNTLPTGSNLVLEVELSGASAGASADGLTIRAPNVVVKGLLIDGWSRDGIEVKEPTTTNARIEGNFIGGNGGSGVYVLDTPSTVIGGTSAAARNVISANLDGVTAQASNTRIEGNLIGTDPSGTQDLGNSQNGVWLFFAHDAVIGGTSSEAGNVISGNASSSSFVQGGVYIQGSGATNNRIEGNLIGTNASGNAALGNSANGVLIDGAPSNVVGGTSAGARNVISSNDRYGVYITGGGAATNNRVEGNYIGTDASGNAPLGNFAKGVYIGGSSNVVGGTSAGARNVISANKGEGVVIGGNSNRVEGNYIGTGASGTTPLGNTGVGVHIGGDGGSSNVVGGTSAGARNVISANGSGVWVQTEAPLNNNRIEGNFIGTDKNGGPLGNLGVGIFLNVFAQGTRIVHNSIFANGGLGIDLSGSGVTNNDPGDGDFGANDQQNFPQISALTPITKRVHHRRRQFTLITGTLNSNPGQTFTVQFFSSPVADPSGYGEGKTFLGELTNVTTDQNGDASLTIQVARSKAPEGSVITATATNNSTGDTSEFSRACTVDSSSCPPG